MNPKKTIKNKNLIIGETQFIVDFDSGGNILSANDAFLNLFEYSLNEIEGKHHRILLTKAELKSNNYLKLWELLKKGETPIGKFERKTKKGRIIWTQSSYNLIYDKNGKLFKVREIATDITERANSETKLTESLKEISDYKSALDASAIVAISDSKGIIKYVNDKFCEISKYKREELIGQDHRIINSGYHTKEFIRELWRTIASGKLWKGNIKNKAKDGTFYWVDTTIIPFFNQEGKPFQYLSIRFDITTQKKQQDILDKLKSEEAVRASELSPKNCKNWRLGNRACNRKSIVVSRNVQDLQL
jgi:PAS domain S-box-containing protein